MPRLLRGLLLLGLLTGCADAMQRYRTVGLTETQRTDVALFETVIRFVGDSFGRPFKVQSGLSNFGYPTVGMEPDGTRGDQDLATEARRTVLRRLGIEETLNATGGGCVIASKWEIASKEREYNCPQQPEVRVGIGPFYQNLGRPWLPGGNPDELQVNVVRLEIGPRGFVLWNYMFEMRRRNGEWYVARVDLQEMIG